MLITDTTSNQDYGIEEYKKKKQFSGELNLTKVKPKVPDINLSVPEISNQAENQTNNQSQDNIENNTQTQPSNSGEGINMPNIKIDVPEFGAGIDLKPYQEFTDYTINTTIDAGNNIASGIEQAMADYTQVVDGFFEPVKEATEEVTSFTGETIEQVAETTNNIIEPIIEPVTGIVKEMTDFIGDTSQPIINLMETASQPIIQAIENTVMPITELIGETSNYLIDSSSITKGDGSGYGQIAIGDTGYVVDSSKVLDDAYATVMQGTVLEGTSGKDVYDLITDPSTFVKDKSIELAKETLVENMGMDSGLAGDVISAIQDPSNFIENKGMDSAVNLVASNTGIDSGIVKVGMDLLTAKDAGEFVQKAAETALKSAATNTTYAVVSAIPVIGSAIVAIAQIFRYSCYLSSGAYINNFITKKQYIEFTRYRIDIQSKEKMAKQVWIGYQLFFRPVMLGMLKNKKFAQFIMWLWVNPWYRYINNLKNNKKHSLCDYIRAKSIKWISLMTYYVLLPKSLMMSKQSIGVNVIQSYKNIISFISTCRRKEALYGK